MIELNGTKTTGIFRISISNELKDKMIERLRSNDYQLEFNDPHVPAVLFKHFLRSLKEPLVPFYEQAIVLSDVENSVEDNFEHSFNKIKMLWELCKVSFFFILTLFLFFIIYLYFYLFFYCFYYFYYFYLFLFFFIFIFFYFYLFLFFLHFYFFQLIQKILISMKIVK